MKCSLCLQAQEDQVRWLRTDLFPVLNVGFPVHLAANERQSSAQSTVRCISTPELPRSIDSTTCSYVQELEARLLHMESLFSQIAPVLEQIGPSTNGANPAAALAAASTDPGTAEKVNAVTAVLRPVVSVPKERSQTSTPVKAEDDFSESFGQLALDEYGHMRWIGGSSTMSLIQSFRALTSSPLHRISPMDEDPHAPGPSVNKLYFPASVFFGKVQALPGPEEVEYPERDLADKLVCTPNLK